MWIRFLCLRLANTTYKTMSVTAVCYADNRYGHSSRIARVDRRSADHQPGRLEEEHSVRLFQAAHSITSPLTSTSRTPLNYLLSLCSDTEAGLASSPRWSHGFGRPSPLAYLHLRSWSSSFSLPQVLSHGERAIARCQSCASCQCRSSHI